jgi:RNA polymerase subunit RPABC4/transcription elongation factor Spt4
MFIFIILSILMALAALLAVAYPVLTKGSGSEPVVASAEETIDELLAQRDGIFQALRELRFDHEVGKITDEDYVVFEASLRQTAAGSLRALDEWESGANHDLDTALEAAVTARTVALAAGEVACPRCGRMAGPADKFCGRCGAALPEAAAAELACPNCGRPVESGDQFCAGCGQQLGGTQ